MSSPAERPPGREGKGTQVAEKRTILVTMQVSSSPHSKLVYLGPLPSPCIRTARRG